MTAPFTQGSRGCSRTSAFSDGSQSVSGITTPVCMNEGMTATGSHFDFDSLRGAPLARNDIVLFGHFAILRQLPGCSRTGGFFDGSRKYQGMPHQCAHWLPMTCSFSAWAGADRRNTR